MKFGRRLVPNQQGAATIEMAFALPVLIVMIWAMVQLGLVYRANAGMQQALGEGARFATLCVNPTINGCSAPTATNIKTKISGSVFGASPGTFTVSEPVSGISGSSRYFDLTVSYSQPTNLLLFPGPTINISRSKRVWVAAT